jgi:Flp pilus assembly protein TadG
MIPNKFISKFARNEEGSALVELYFAGMFLAFLVMGAAEMGRVAWAAIEVTDAAHAAVQYATTSHAAASDYSYANSKYAGGIVNAATANEDNFGTNTISVSSIAQSCTCANSTYTPLSCSDNSTCTTHNTVMEETISVQTQVTFSPMIHWPGLPNQFTLYGSAIQRVSNQ